jgi:hypothetical protein
MKSVCYVLLSLFVMNFIVIDFLADMDSQFTMTARSVLVCQGFLYICACVLYISGVLCKFLTATIGVFTVYVVYEIVRQDRQRQYDQPPMFRTSTTAVEMNAYVNACSSAAASAA